MHGHVRHAGGDRGLHAAGQGRDRTRRCRCCSPGWRSWSSGFAFITPSLNSLLSRWSDPAKQGGILGIGQSISSLARIVGPMAGVPLFENGPLAESLGVKAAELPLFLATGLMGIGLVLILIAASRGRDLARPSQRPILHGGALASSRLRTLPVLENREGEVPLSRELPVRHHSTSGSAEPRSTQLCTPNPPPPGVSMVSTSPALAVNCAAAGELFARAVGAHAACCGPAPRLRRRPARTADTGRGAARGSRRPAAAGIRARARRRRRRDAGPRRPSRGESRTRAARTG